MPTKKPKPTDVLVGQRVRMARLMANMSQTELGEHIGITFQQVQKYEKGGNRISSSRLAQISDVLGKPVSWFFDEARSRAAAKLDGAPDILQKMLTIRGGVALAEAFTRIKSAILRRHIIDLAKSIADETRTARRRAA
jgi:transcriptional regulator with XRE-family HTH domain